MNSLLQRQIRKYLRNDDFSTLFKYISDTYYAYDDNINMLQRAMKISSDELFEANQKLRVEAESLKEINSNLEGILKEIKSDGSKDSNLNFSHVDLLKKQSEEIIKINQQQEKLVQTLELQNQALNEYAHVVSHDLKAPLRSINALISWYIEDNESLLSEDNKQSLNLILFNVEKMDLLIKGILDYSSIDDRETDENNVDLNYVVEEIKSTLVLQKSFQIKINNYLPTVNGNVFRFKQLFQNIIENAVKYNDKEVGIIEIGSVEKDTEIEFYIKDNGKGIPEAYFQKIFNIFTKLENNDQSSGIGLSIVKKIILQYGGRIWLESKENIGTTFFFTILK
ncbi:sensor histidine kinase [Flavobacterium psychrotrophum]|uniref:sensor histidine kinase n=1 Tax=Flavobacterium psychrotrophum TaxID=2294119 RepID=UPI000E31975D|nr:ATP-binding protein [Flavobacterium psychrotrophum]